MHVVYADDDFPKEFFDSFRMPSMFLVGPTPRAERPALSWRKEALQILESLDFTGIVAVPEWSSSEYQIDYISQVEWERAGLKNSTAIAAWVARDIKGNMPAFTTNVEFGYWLAIRPHSVFYGRPDEADKCRYLDWLYKEDKGVDPHNDMRSMLSEAAAFANLACGID